LAADTAEVVRSRRTSRRAGTNKALARLTTFVLFALGWQVFATAAGGLLIPTFTETAEALIGLLRDPELWDGLVVSNQALAIGFVLAVAVGVPLGLLMGRFRTLERVTDPYVNIMLVTPMAAIIPLLVMSVGIGLASRVALVVLFALPMVIVNTQAGVRQVDDRLIEMAVSYGATERQVWSRILLRGAMPGVMAGIRIGLGRAITGMVVVELLMVSVGLGGLILNFRAFFRVGDLYAVVIIVVIEALILISATRWVERRVVPWADAESVLA
jgi:NitT/TauT family transport system permease protein